MKFILVMGLGWQSLFFGLVGVTVAVGIGVLL
jgi:hypothetical protein